MWREYIAHPTLDEPMLSGEDSESTHVGTPPSETLSVIDATAGFFRVEIAVSLDVAPSLSTGCLGART